MGWQIFLIPSKLEVTVAGPMAAAAPGSDSALPLVVSLDGGLVNTRLQFELANRAMLGHPLRNFSLAIDLATGRSAHSEQPAFEASALPYRAELLAWLQEQRAQGRRIVLAARGDRHHAEAVASHLQLFDEVVDSDSLQQRFGAGNFDYVGGRAEDLEHWRLARHAHIVGGNAALLRRVGGEASVGRVFDMPPRSTARALLRAMRPHQWAKNVLVLVPLLTAHRYADAASALQAVLAFLAFGLTASSVYLLNDLIDVADDRHHARKRLRPIAAGELGMLQAWLAWPALLAAGWLLAAATLPLPYLGALAVYIGLTLAYSLRLKQSPVVDVLALACLYTLRIIAGAAAIGVPLSFWLLSFSMFIFLSLAFVKRFNELRTARQNHASGNLRGRGYRPEDLEMVSSLGISSGYLSVLVLALYIQDTHTAEMYTRTQVLWLACPTMLFWISRTWMIANRGWMHDDPIVFALKDRNSLVTGAIMVGIFAAARLLP